MQITIGVFLVSAVVFFWSLINLIAIVQKHGHRVSRWDIFVAILLLRLSKLAKKHTDADRKAQIFVAKMYVAVFVLLGTFVGAIVYSILKFHLGQQ